MVDENTAVVDAPEAETAGTEPLEGAQASLEEPDSKEDARIRKANEEAKRYREQARQAQAELDTLKRKDESEQDKLKREHEQAVQAASALETENRNLRAAIAAYKFGVRPEAVSDIPKLIDWDAVDDAGDQKQIDKAVREFVKQRPYFGGQVDYDAGAGRGSRLDGKPSLGAFVRREAGIPT